LPEPDNKAREALDLAIDNELRQARDRAASLEQRATAVVTTSGVLVSLMFGFWTLIKGKQITNLPEAPRILLALALVLFICAAIIALFVIMPRNYPAQSFWKGVLGSWIRSPSENWESITNLHLKEIGHWLRTNDLKAKTLLASIMAECIGIGLLAVCMLVVIL
jgi:integral membrane sensor domain MASE1